jgi:hypothetical protein
MRSGLPQPWTRGATASAPISGAPENLTDLCSTFRSCIGSRLAGENYSERLMKSRNTHPMGPGNRGYEAVLYRGKPPVRSYDHAPFRLPANTDRNPGCRICADLIYSFVGILSDRISYNGKYGIRNEWKPEYTSHSMRRKGLLR